MDLTELQRNMAYYGMEGFFPFPLFYYDVQKLYGLFAAEGARLSLDAAVEQEGILEDRPFHRALDLSLIHILFTAILMKILRWKVWRNVFMSAAIIFAGNLRPIPTVR